MRAASFPAEWRPAPWINSGWHAERILERVWGYDFGGDDNVLKGYIGYLRKKTEAGGEPRLIQTVRGVGYVLREE